MSLCTSKRVDACRRFAEGRVSLQAALALTSGKTRRKGRDVTGAATVSVGIREKRRRFTALDERQGDPSTCTVKTSSCSRRCKTPRPCLLLCLHYRITVTATTLWLYQYRIVQIKTTFLIFFLYFFCIVCTFLSPPCTFSSPRPQPS